MLQDRTQDAFQRALAALDATATGDGEVTARTALQAARAHLDEPMVVALVGRISSGKSTLTNALLGSDLVATGARELTFNVNVLRHGDTPSLLLHLRDGRTEQRSVADLELVTARAEEHRELLAGIDWVEVFVPNDRLRILDLVDTPGLDSVFGEDSANSLRFLRRTAQDVRAQTLARSTRADALLLVFSRSIGGVDEDVVADFSRGVTAATPINTIGVLTKVEDYWPGETDPIAAGRRVADRLMREPGVRRILFAVQPVASLVGFAAETLGPEEHEELTLLAKTPPDVLEQRVRRGKFFCERDYDDVALPADRRAPLYARYRGWGLTVACALIRDGVDSAEELRGQLVELSGLADLRRLVESHFGNRAFLIKLQRALADVRSLPRRLEPPVPASVQRAAAELERLELNEPAFEELGILRDHYDGLLALDADEVEELLRVSGERGVWVTDRLGLPRTATLDEMYDIARRRLRFWSYKDADPLVMGRTREATRTIRRSYERLLHHIGAARAHLELIQ